MGSGLADVISAGLRSPNLQVENPMQAQLQYQQAQALKQQRLASQQEMSQSAQQSEQTQQMNDLKIQEAQQAQQSQSNIMRAMQANPGDLNAIVKQASQMPGTLPDHLITLQKGFAAAQTDAANADIATVNARDKHYAAAQQELNGFLQNDEDTAAKLWPSAAQGWIKDNDLKPSDFANIGISPDTYPGHQKVQQLLTGAQTLGAINDQELKRRQGLADDAKARLDNANAATKELQAKSLQEMQADPSKTLALIDNITPLDTMFGSNSRYKSQLSFYINRGDQDGIDKVIAAANSEAKERSMALDPAIEANKVKEAKDAAAAKAPIIIQQVTAENAAKNAATNPVADLGNITYTTGAGRQYINSADLGKNRQALVQAQNAGIPVVDPATHETLEEIDNARGNMAYMLSRIQNKLATDPTGRLFQGPANTLEKLGQTDPDLASVGTYRTAAIQSLRAVAGSKGLRINKAEIDQAKQDDIPLPTDTLPVAKQKIANMMAFLDNAEKVHLTKDRSTITTPPQAGGGNAGGAAQGGYKIGGTYGNHKYLGGDPNQPSSWQ